MQVGLMWMQLRDDLFAFIFVDLFWVMYCGATSNKMYCLMRSHRVSAIVMLLASDSGNYVYLVDFLS